jgi:hypothetical protein
MRSYAFESVLMWSFVVLIGLTCSYVDFDVLG